MKTFTFTAALAGLASTATAEFVSALSVRSASPVHFLPLTASGLRLHLNGQTSSYCPDSVVESCPNSTVTSLIVGDASSISMGADVPGGQQVYIDPKTGAVGYTQAHSVSAPEGAIFDGWSWTYSQENNLGTLSYKDGLVACPRGSGVWDVLAQVPGLVFTGDCLGFNLVTSNTTGPTQWQYI